MGMSDGQTSYETLRSIWRTRDRKKFDAWVRDLSLAIRDSELTLEAAARALEQTPATVEAVLQLDQLQDDELALLVPNVPPQTTWFLFSGATREQIQKGLEALEAGSEGKPPSRIVEHALGLDSGEDLQEALRTLPGDIYKHLAKKATKYNVLRPKDRSALTGFGTTRERDKLLSDKQVAYAEGLIRKMVDEGAIKRDSMDDDREICAKILDIFRM
jgi:hypothetical protein